jgi:hypothetical protein
MQPAQGNDVPAAHRSQAQRSAISSSVPTISLECLAGVLNPREYVTVLITGEDRRPGLTVVRRHSPVAAEIYADAGSYWWGGDAERIAPITDPAAAARAIHSRLGAVAEPAQGIGSASPPADLCAGPTRIPRQR